MLVIVGVKIVELLLEASRLCQLSIPDMAGMSLVFVFKQDMYLNG